jgi:alpha-N-arabinofuranosidase
MLPGPESQFQNIYGQFIEHLGRCIYGGIWAEMLEDRKFYYSVRADYSPWKIIKPPNNRWSGAGVPYKVLGASSWQPIGPDNAVRMVKEDSYVGEHMPEVRVTGDGKPCGIAQNELALINGKEYVGRVVIAAEPDVLPVEVSLVWGKGKDDRDTVMINTTGRAGQFRKHPLRFKARAPTENGRLEKIRPGKGLNTMMSEFLSL